MSGIALIVFTALATAVIGFVVVRYGPGLERFLGRRPVRARVELDAVAPRIATQLDPAVFESGLPNWEAYGYVFPLRIEEVGIPPSSLCREWREWARPKGGVDGRWTKVQVMVEGRAEGQVVIDRLDVEVLGRHEPKSGTYVFCPVGGASASPREISIRLDNDPSSVGFIEQGYEPATEFLFTLGKGEVETFRIYAMTDRYYCEWIARLSYVADDKRGSIEISDEGEPFRTTGITNAQAYVWSDGGWTEHDDFAF
jgi:hypothetical protein